MSRRWRPDTRRISVDGRAVRRDVLEFLFPFPNDGRITSYLMTGNAEESTPPGSIVLWLVSGGGRPEIDTSLLDPAQIRMLEGRVGESPDDSAAALELRAARTKFAWTTASLAEAARLLDTIGVSTSEYRQLLIRATGSLTQDIFDPEVARGLIDEAVDDASEWAKDNGATAAFQLLKRCR